MPSVGSVSFRRLPPWSVQAGVVAAADELIVLQQLIPALRFDGYYVLADVADQVVVPVALTYLALDGCAEILESLGDAEGAESIYVTAYEEQEGFRPPPPPTDADADAHASSTWHGR